MLENVYYLNNERSLSLVERFGGTILSVCFHLAFFSILFINRQSLNNAPADVDSLIRVSLLEIPELRNTDSHDPVTDDENMGQIEMSSDTRSDTGNEPKDKSGVEDIMGRVERMPLKLPILDPELRAPLDGEHMIREQHELLELMAERSRQQEFMNDQLAVSGSNAVGERLDLLNVDHVAGKTLFADRKVRDGSIRKFDIAGVSAVAAQEVLDRYGIRTYLSGAKNNTAMGRRGDRGTGMSGGRFINASGKGDYHIFSYSRVAGDKFSQLEIDALKRAGHDPDKVRILKIIFGIVSIGDGYDLGIKSIKVIPIQPSVD